MNEPLTDTGLRWQTEKLADGPADGVDTIVILGNSIVYGWGMRYEESYPALVERWLNEGHKARRWRVINAGVPGNTALMGADRYDRDVARFQPRVVVLAFGLNDGALRRTMFDAQREELWLAEHRVWHRLGYHLKRPLRALARRRWGPAQGADEVQRDELPRVRARRFVEALDEMVGKAQRSGAQVLLAPMAPVACAELAPVARGRLAPAQWRAYVCYNDLITDMARTSGAQLIGLTLGAQDPPAHEILASDGVHLTALGQRWLAAQVLAALQPLCASLLRPL